MSKGVELHFGLGDGFPNYEEAYRFYMKGAKAISLSIAPIASFCIWLLFTEGKLPSIGEENAKRHIQMAAELGHEGSRKIVRDNPQWSN